MLSKPFYKLVDSPPADAEAFPPHHGSDRGSSETSLTEVQSSQLTVVGIDHDETAGT